MRSLVVDAYAQCGPCVERCGTLVTPSSSLGLCPSQTSSHSRQASVTRPDFTAGALGSSIPVASLKPTCSSRYPGQRTPLSVSWNENDSSLSKEVEDVACRRRRWRPASNGNPRRISERCQDTGHSDLRFILKSQQLLRWLLLLPHGNILDIPRVCAGESKAGESALCTPSRESHSASRLEIYYRHRIRSSRRGVYNQDTQSLMQFAKRTVIKAVGQRSRERFCASGINNQVCETVKPAFYVEYVLY
jgi:hypothetical protein